jgi:hypothetical protein
MTMPAFDCHKNRVHSDIQVVECCGMRNGKETPNHGCDGEPRRMGGLAGRGGEPLCHKIKAQI